jgi:fibronectin type 3 domain-containing protein
MKIALFFGLVLSLGAVSTKAAAPPAPANVRVIYLPAEILFTWDGSPEADHYRVYRGGPDRRWVPLPLVTAPSFRDTDFASPVPGYYMIAAVSDVGELSATAEFFVDAAPPRPQA